MIVEKINITLDKIVDDSAYSLRKSPVKYDLDAKFIRLKLLKKINTPELRLDCLRSYGLNSSMQSNLRLSGELLEYIEEQFR